jgi:hypothetical protein
MKTMIIAALLCASQVSFAGRPSLLIEDGVGRGRPSAAVNLGNDAIQVANMINSAEFKRCISDLVKSGNLIIEQILKLEQEDRAVYTLNASTVVEGDITVGSSVLKVTASFGGEFGVGYTCKVLENLESSVQGLD